MTSRRGFPVLRQLAGGAFVHESQFLQSNTVVVQGGAGVLLVDPGITRSDITCLANDLRELGQPVVAGFSTHPHWDHLLWHEALGDAPRYGTTRCAAIVRDQQSDPGWQAREAEELPPEIADDVPLELMGRITGLPAGAPGVPWGGPRIRILEHEAHAPGHAALLIEEASVLVAGDMLSDVLIPFLDLAATDPVGDYLAALRLLEGVADDVDVFVPGHGSVGGGDELQARIDLDRAYLHGLRNGDVLDDPRLRATALHGAWLPGVDGWQRRSLAGTGTRSVASADMG